jgi:hypothetical protein
MQSGSKASPDRVEHVTTGVVPSGVGTARSSLIPLHYFLDTIISTFPPFIFTFHSNESFADKSVIFTTASGIVVLKEGELGLAIVIFEINSPTLFLGIKCILIYL